MAKRWAPMLVALLVAANGLTAGASLDDWMHHALVHGELAKRAWWDLFNFADGSPGSRCLSSSCASFGL
jgi:hypothetical protein